MPYRLLIRCYQDDIVSNKILAAFGLAVSLVNHVMGYFHLKVHTLMTLSIINLQELLSQGATALVVATATGAGTVVGKILVVALRRWWLARWLKRNRKHKKTVRHA